MNTKRRYRLGPVITQDQITFEVLVSHYGSVKAICQASLKHRDPGKPPLTTQNVYAWRSKRRVTPYWRMVFAKEISS